MDSAAKWEEARGRLLESAAEEMSELMLRVLADLPPRDLLMLELRAGGLDFEGIGHELNLSEAAARQAWRRARRRVRRKLTAETLIDEIMETEEWEE